MEQPKPLVKYLLLPCYTSRPEDFDMEGAIVELTDEQLQSMITVIESFGPLSDKLKEMGTEQLRALEFPAEVEWLEFGTMEYHLGEIFQESSEPLDLTNPLDSGFDDLVITEATSRITSDGPVNSVHRAILSASQANTNQSLKVVKKVESWFDMISTEHLDNTDFENTRLHITNEWVYWTAYHAFGEASNVQVETRVLELSYLKELLQELKDGKGLPPKLREQQYHQLLKEREERNAESSGERQMR